MRSILGVVLSVCILTVVRADDKSESPGGVSDAGLAVIKRAANAAKKAKVVKYEAVYEGTAWATAYVPAITGEVVVGEQSKWEINRFRADIKVKPYDKDETTEVVAGCDGDIYFLIDPSKKIVYEDMDQAVMGTGARNLQRVVVSALGSPEPFKDLLEAKTIEVQGTKTIGNEECDEVHIVDAEGQESLWCFAKKDGLPRSIERIYKNNEGEKATTHLVLRNVVVNPKFGKAPFKAEVPPGFTKTDDFAP